jgi:hypothetical protein
LCVAGPTPNQASGSAECWMAAHRAMPPRARPTVSWESGSSPIQWNHPVDISHGALTSAGVKPPFPAAGWRVPAHRSRRGASKERTLTDRDDWRSRVCLWITTAESATANVTFSSVIDLSHVSALWCATKVSLSSAQPVDSRSARRHVRSDRQAGRRAQHEVESPERNNHGARKGAWTRCNAMSNRQR